MPNFIRGPQLKVSLPRTVQTFFNKLNKKPFAKLKNPPIAAGLKILSPTNPFFSPIKKNTFFNAQAYASKPLVNGFNTRNYTTDADRNEKLSEESLKLFIEQSMMPYGTFGDDRLVSLTQKLPNGKKPFEMACENSNLTFIKEAVEICIRSNINNNIGNINNIYNQAIASKNVAVVNALLTHADKFSLLRDADIYPQLKELAVNNRGVITEELLGSIQLGMIQKVGITFAC